MPNWPDLSVVDQFGHRVTIDHGELDRAVRFWNLEKTLHGLYSDEPFSECPVCGTSPKEAAQTALMGCAACYATIYPTYQQLLSGSAPLSKTQ